MQKKNKIDNPSNSIYIYEHINIFIYIYFVYNNAYKYIYTYIHIYTKCVYIQKYKIASLSLERKK